jgi:hypothetical protein
VTWSRLRVAGLVVALVAAGVFLAGSPPRRAAPSAQAGTVATTWPGARQAAAPALLADGTTFTPLLYVDVTTAVGSAPSADKSTGRLLLRTGADQPRELHRVPADRNPQFAGLMATGDDVVWAESTADASGHAETRIMKASLKSAAPARSLTADTGDAIFFNSQYDLVVAGGRVHWAAAAQRADVVTEVRSVALTGGKVTVRTVPGAYAMSAWPWLVSAGSGQAGPVDLVNLDTGGTVRVPAAQAELVACSPAWCRVLVITGTGGPARIDLMHPDGSGRQRMAGGQASASIADVALLDRFEVLSQNDRQLQLYDAKTKRTVQVAAGVGMVFARGGVLTWSTGDNEALVWHALDLRTLR